MRTIALCSVGALLLGASAIGCYDEPERPAVQSRAAVVTQPAPRQQTGGSVTVVHHDEPRGVTATQPTAQPNPPVINNFVTAPPSQAQDPSAQPSPPTAQPAPITAQPTDDRARASQIVAEATRQIDRLTRVLSMSARDDRHSEIEAAVGQLEAKRERVLKDIKTLETTGASSSDDTQHILLNRDVSDLQLALQKSYEFAPPSTQ